MDTTVNSEELNALVEGPFSLAKLGRFARELGYLLPTAAVQDLRELRAELAASRDRLGEPREEKSFIKGVLFGMIEVCASYAAEIQAHAERRQLVAMAEEKPLHSALLRKLFEGLTRPSDLASALGKDPAQISRALGELRKTGLIELVSPDPTRDQRQRFHRLTTEGLRLVSAQGWPSSPGEPKPSEYLAFEFDSSAACAEPAAAPKLREGARPQQEVADLAVSGLASRGGDFTAGSITRKPAVRLHGNLGPEQWRAIRPCPPKGECGERAEKAQKIYEALPAAA